MNKKNWILWALFLLLPGAVGLGIHFAQKSAMHKRISLSAEQTAQDPAAQEYLQMHEQWANLAAHEKADNPWGYGSYGGSDIQKRLQEGQFDRLTADLPSLKRGMSHYPEEIAEVMYGPGWQQTVEEYKKKLAVSEMILIGSTFLLAVGGLIVGGGMAKTAVWLLVKWRKHRKEQLQSEDENVDEIQDEQILDGDSPKIQETVDDPSFLKTDTQLPTPDGLSLDTQADTLVEKQETPKQENIGYFQSHKKVAKTDLQQTGSVKSEFSTKPIPTSKSDKFGKPKKSQKDSYFGWAVDLNDTSDLETLMTTEPLTRELTELTEEVSAIRQFAAQQQDQMRKLQDGYDWMIIRRFCLRIIRSIDNIEDRIALLVENDQEASNYLEDIRDELVFALESSGIEQFKPDLNITFKGLEKYAEAVRERVLTEDEQLSGCIAQVARPGYQYLVNDDDVKIVRCAQVKLFETKPTE